ncbi:MAG: putative Ig domain-containing protein [Halioglobus sp.]
MRWFSASMAALLLACVAPAFADICDIDADSDVDIMDIRAIAAARNQLASGPDDPRDANGDGIINVYDQRACVLQCTLSRCAIPPPNQAPVITSAPGTEGVEEQLYTYDVEASDSDGDTLTYNLDAAPVGMSIDPTSGLIDWTPAPGQAGSHVVTVRVVDGRSGSATQSYSINVTPGNRDPLITSEPGTSATTNQPYVYAAEATDDDGDTLAYSLDTAPQGMTIDPESGLVQWMPTPAQTGSNAVTVRVEDGKGGFATQDYSILSRRSTGRQLSPHLLLREP